MRFTCAKAEIVQAVNTVAKAASKMQKSILECVLISSGDGVLTLKATDIAISIKTEVDARIDGEGVIAVPARILSEIVNRLPDSDIDFEESGSGSLKISCLNSLSTLQLMNADEFPDLPNIDKGEQIKIPQNTLRKMINQTLFAAATEEDKPILTGLLFDIDINSLTVVGLDGYRMAVRREPAISEIKTSCVIPARTLREISRIAEDTEENIKIAVSGNMALFEAGKTKIYTRLLEGNYINYKNIMPTEFATRMTIELGMLKDSVERASLMATGANNKIIFDVSERELCISSNSEMGEIDETIPVVTEGGDLKIAFNAKYIHDVLKNIDDSELNVYFNTKASPCVLKRKDSEAYEYLVLPVQLREN